MEIITVPAHYVTPLLDALERQGGDREVILGKIDLPRELFDSEKARIPRADYLRLTGYLALKLQDECLGLLQQPVKPGSFAMLCHACISCDSLEHFIKRMTRYAKQINDGLRFELTAEGDYASLAVKMDNGKTSGEDLYVMLALSVFHRLITWVSDQEIPLIQVNIRKSRPFYASDYNLLFRAPINFAQEENSIQFSREYLHARIRQDEASLRGFLGDSAIHLMSEPESDSSLSSRIRGMIKGEVAGQFPSFEQISLSLNSSPTTLRRKLLNEGNTYQSIKDSVRRDKAIYCLTQQSLNLDEVAARAGFSDPTSFFRAFKRWTGTSPRAYVRA